MKNFNVFIFLGNIFLNPFLKFIKISRKGRKNAFCNILSNIFNGNKIIELIFFNIFFMHVIIVTLMKIKYLLNVSIYIIIPNKIPKKIYKRISPIIKNKNEI